jgi:hypothetical protein
MEFLDQVLGWIASASGASVAIALVLEFAFRLIPSDKPKSILYLVGAVSKKLGEIFTAIGNLSDKVLPQKLK